MFWEPANPTAGDILTIWFNPDLTVVEDTGSVAFNGKSVMLVQYACFFRVGRQ